MSELRDHDHGRDRVGWKSRVTEIPTPGNKVSIIMAAYERPASLRASLAAILAQSWADWELFVMHDGPASDAIRRVVQAAGDSRVQLVESGERVGSHGNHHRHHAEVALASGDWVLHTNDDNYYVPAFLEAMLYEAAQAHAELVYCNFVSSHYSWRPIDAKLKVSHIDYGAFLARRELAHRVPWPPRHVYCVDGLRAEDLKRAARGIAKCQSYLFVHN